jgi:intracellular septation protein
LALALWAFKKNVVRTLLGAQMELPERVWERLNLIWLLYCAFMASINAYVAAYYSTEDWVNFKLWGYAFPLVFIIGQGLYIAPHVKLRGTEGEGPAP